MDKKLKKQIDKLRKDGKEQEASQLESSSEGYQHLDYYDKIFGSRKTAEHVNRLAKIFVAVIVFIFFLIFITKFL